MARRSLNVILGLLVLLVAALGLLASLNLRDESPVSDQPEPFAANRQQIERGEYLARAGNCAACHTARGGAAFAGGQPIATPFGTVFASNLTRDETTGIGRWNASHFWRAMHNGRSRDGRLLTPAFPYPNYTQIRRADSDAIFAYLRSLPPVVQPNRPHELRFPYNTQFALAVWRALYFEPGVYRPDTSRSAEWNRGSYLVRGLGHCNACHSGRNAFGATADRLELSGGLIPMQNWYAPALNSPLEAGVAQWDESHVVALLKTGVAPRASVMGPMAEVVYRSTQHLNDDDLRAMAVFLRELPQQEPAARATEAVNGATMAAGGKVYARHCAQCHGDVGEGKAGAYPALAGNRAVTLDVPANLVRAVLSGGYLPSTAGNPRPYGMPPFSQSLDDAEIAAVLTFVRNSWGNRAAEVSQLEVLRYR